MDYSVNLSIDDALRQIHDLHLWAWFVAAYFGTGIAQWAGKRFAMRKINKAIDPIADAFYEGARYGLAKSWVDCPPVNAHLIDLISNSLIQAKITKRQVWV